MLQVSWLVDMHNSDVWQIRLHLSLQSWQRPQRSQYWHPVSPVLRAFALKGLSTWSWQHGSLSPTRYCWPWSLFPSFSSLLCPALSHRWQQLKLVMYKQQQVCTSRPELTFRNKSQSYGKTTHSSLAQWCSQGCASCIDSHPSLSLPSKPMLGVLGVSQNHLWHHNERESQPMTAYLL